MGAEVFDRIRKRLAPRVREAGLSHGILVLQLDARGASARGRRLKAQFGFDLFLDVTAVDWPGQSPRFEVVWHFYSTAHKVRVRLKTRVTEQDPTVDSLVALYGSARIMERECHDMYGIAFRGNSGPAPASCSTRASSAIRCARTTPKSGSSRSCPTGTDGDAVDLNLPNPVRPAFDRTEHDDAVIVNIGPSHPATHGTVQIIAALDGERVAAHRRALRLPAPRASRRSASRTPGTT